MYCPLTHWWYRVSRYVVIWRHFPVSILPKITIHTIDGTHADIGICSYLPYQPRNRWRPVGNTIIQYNVRYLETYQPPLVINTLHPLPIP